MKHKRIIAFFTAFLLIAVFQVKAAPVALPSDNDIEKTASSKTVLSEMVDSGSVAAETMQNTASDPTPTEPYQLVAQTESLALYADSYTGDFALYDKKEKHVWYSTPADYKEDKSTKGNTRTDIRSMLVVHYVELATIASSPIPQSINSYIGSVYNDDVTYSPINNGYRVEYRFTDEQFTIPVEVTLSEQGLKVTVKGDQIKYEDSGKLITSIDVLTGMMAAGTKAQGYLFVPSGSGALVTLNNGRGEYGSYSEMVYGEDAAIKKDEQKNLTPGIKIPVYGIKNGNYSLTAIITEGDTNAMIQAEGTHKTMGYNRVYSTFVTATLDQTLLFEADFFNQRIIYEAEIRDKLGDYSVLYIPSGGGNADYVGMANIYRQYLLDNGMLKKNPQKPSLAINLYGSATKKDNFLGIPYTKTFAMTTFKQAQEILEDLSGNGVDSIAFRYQGWNNSGLENKKVPIDVKPVKVLGGKGGYKSLISYLKNTDTGSVEAYFDVDFMTIRKSGNGFSVLSDVVKTMFNTRTPKYKYMRSVYVPVLNEKPWYLLRPDELLKAAKKFAPKWDGVSGLSLAGFGDTLYSDFSKNSITRTQTVDYYQQAIKEFEGTPLAVDGGNAYTYPYVDRVFAVPETNNGDLLFDQSVPFLQIVLHGYISYTTEDINRYTDPGKAILNCIETGSDPYFCGMYLDASELIETNFNHFYSSSYSQWSDMAKEIFKKYESVYRGLYDKRIIGHQKLDNGITVTSFENGTKVLANYSDKPQAAEGIMVDAYSFGVLNG